MTDKNKSINKNATTQDIDPVTLAVLSKRFDVVTTKMANTLFTTGRSGVLNQARDFSTSIITKNSELLTGAESLPIHCLSGADLMSKTMLEMHPDLKKGDAFLHNSPYHGCSHAADLTLMVPVIDTSGEHHFTCWVKAHQADIGNSQPTTYMGEAKDVYNEGALIFPSVKVQDNYKDVQDIIRMCRMRIRVPDQWYGDYLAMVGAARVGERELFAMAKEFGWETLNTFSRQWFDYSEKRMISAVREIPAGKVSATSTHDAIPGTPQEGIKITVHVDVDPDREIIEVDLRDNPDTIECGLNLSESCARTAAMIGIFNSVNSDVPKNQGAFRRIKIHIREGSITGGGKHPTSMSVSTTNLADRVTNSVQRAFSKIKDGFGLAECGSVIPACAGVISGKDPRHQNEAFVNQIFLAFTGGAAAASTDAWTTIAHAGNAGMCFIDSVELDELHYPVFVNGRRLMIDTEGAGRTTGAPSGYCEFGPSDDNPLDVGWIADGVNNMAKGTQGGLKGAPIRNIRKKVSGELEELPGSAAITLQPGETVITHTGGGGGYGPPIQRPVNKVRDDVAEGYVSKEHAKAVYGVILDESGQVNEAETDLKRTTLKNEGEFDNEH